MERQPRYWVNNPPAKGPKANPRYTAETEIPKTRPRYWGKKAETRIAGPVVLENAPPMPCKKRKRMSQNPEGDKPQANDEKVKITTPHLNIRRTPDISAQRPEGSRNIAVASRKEVTTQLRVTAPSEKLFSMAGNAIFTDEIRNVPINEVTATMAKIDSCFLLHSITVFLRYFNVSKIPIFYSEENLV